jgi:hypothetical protein
MDSTDVGLYGTLRLVKRLNPHSVVASFPIDDDTVSFGRDPNCSVRLYYPTVSALHAKIVFQEKKVRSFPLTQSLGTVDLIWVRDRRFWWY